MEFNDISLKEKPMKNPEKVWNTYNSLDSVGTEKVDALKQSIEEIELLIKNRQKLNKEMFEDCEEIKSDIRNFFIENPTGEKEVREKIALKQKQVEISELQLRERVSCWQDIAELKKELREKQKELAEKQGRINMLGKILEE